MSDFIDGINMFTKNPKAPDFVLGDLSIDPIKLKKWCEEEAMHVSQVSSDGVSRVRAQILLSQGGKPYIKINNYQKNNTPEPTVNQNPYIADGDLDDEMPF